MRRPWRDRHGLHLGGHVLNFSAAHWVRDGTHHGSQSRPRVAAASLVRITGGWRLWLYFRGGYACHAEWYALERDWC